MSTLAEIEAAVEALPAAEQFILLHRLEVKMRERPQGRARLVMENGRAVLVAPPGAPEMTPELIRALRDDDV